MEVSNHGETVLIRASRADSPESVRLLLESARSPCQHGGGNYSWLRRIDVP